MEQDYAYKQAEPIIKYKKVIQEGEQESYIETIYFCKKHRPFFKQWIRHKPYYESNYTNWIGPR